MTGSTRCVGARPRHIVPAVDLGGVEVLKQGNLFLLSDDAGDIAPDGRGLGLYDGDTRLLSMASLRIGGRRPVVLAADPGGTWRGVLRASNPQLRDASTEEDPAGRVIPPRTLALTRERWIAGALHERVTVVNDADEAVALTITLGIDADLADIFEVRGYPRPARGELLPIEINDAAGTVTFACAGLDGVTRRTKVELEPVPAFTASEGTDATADGLGPPSIVASWALVLEPGASWTFAWTAGGSPDPPAPKPAHGVRTSGPARSDADPERSQESWRAAATTFESDNPLVNQVIRRSIDDLSVLINATPDGQAYVAAGVPWFSALFGRDALITGIEAMAFAPWLTTDALRALATNQATVDDAWRDAEPGKIPHEVRTGEMTRSGEVPFGPYYGTADATPLFLVALGEVHDWTGDDALVEELWPNAMAALGWIDANEARAPSGFVDYRPRLPSGFPNQGWKDSPDAIRDGSGRLATHPIALAEVQGYVHEARLRVAQLARHRGDTTLGMAQEVAAADLRRRFADAFGAVDGAIPMALDGTLAPMDAVASNMGHCLWNGIVANHDVEAVAARLMAPDMFSGWGTRTYAAGQPGYDPMGYHTGSVWPHDTAIVAAGLKAVGATEAADRLAAAVLEAAQGFPAFRLPELFCGFERGATGGPVPYPVACSPQAWAAAAPLFLIRTLLGLQPHADRGELVLAAPHLPAFIGEATLRGLRVGTASCDLLVRRRGDATSVDVLRVDEGLEVKVDPA